MSSRRRSLAARTAELAFAAPQVVAHRLAGIAAAAHAPTAHDRREWRLMGSEKVAAFGESWVAMNAEWMRLQQVWLLAWWRWSIAPWASAWPGIDVQGMQRAWQSVLGRGLAPVHRRAVANARRLGRRAAGGR